MILRIRFLRSARQYLKLICDVLLVHRILRSDLVNDFVFHPYSHFYLPKEQAAVCFRNVYHSFSVRRWVTKGLHTVHLEKYLQLIDYVRFAYVDEGDVEPEPSDRTSFLSKCPEFVRKTRIMTMFRPSSLMFGS